MRTRDRKKERTSAARRRAEQHRSGYERTTLKVKGDVSFFALQKEGNVRLDIIPYTVGKGNPYADEGNLHFERTYWAHRGVGPNNDVYVCPAKTAKKPCPICEYRAKLAKDPDADENLVRELGPKERQLWNVIDLDNPDKGVQLWDISFHLFGKLLDDRIKNADDDDEFDFFYEPKSEDGGKTLRLGVSENNFAGRSYYEVTSIDFKPRKKDYDEEVLEQAQNLDEVLAIPDYDKLKALFLEAEQEDDDEDEEEEDKKPARSSASKTKTKPTKRKEVEEDDEDEEEEVKPVKKTKPKTKAPGLKEGDTVDHPEWGECEVKRVSKDGTSVTLEDEEGEIHRAVDAEDLEVEPPKAKKEKSKVKDTELDDEDEDEDDWQDVDDDDEEEEKPKSKAKAKPAKAAKKSKKDEDDEDTEEDDWD